MSLLRAVAPYDDESGLGYYRRLAAENRFWGWRDLAGLVNIARQRRALLEHPEQVAKELGIESAWAQFAARQEQQCRAWRARHRVSSDAICPVCLSESVYIRHHWEHTYVTACAVHRTCLLDHCPACAVLLSPNRVRIERCACGYDLRTSKAPAATVAQHWLSTLIASDGSSSGALNLSYTWWISARHANSCASSACSSTRWYLRLPKAPLTSGQFKRPWNS